MMIRGVRGATTVENNCAEEIISRVEELLTALIKANAIETEDIGALIFSSTPDLNAAFPAVAARRLGWNEVPLFGTQEIEQPDGVKQCVRVLALLNTERSQKEIKHIYLHGATVLRQDVKQ
ncbi:chorismate mutase [Azotosporobacter soli]|uniref:chorismate mutase n=1 Tax=Azotosporobacter soli TaxID=3055040 RepID=UPI0031FE858E